MLIQLVSATAAGDEPICDLEIPDRRVRPQRLYIRETDTGHSRQFERRLGADNPVYFEAFTPHGCDDQHPDVVVDELGIGATVS